MTRKLLSIAFAAVMIAGLSGGSALATGKTDGFHVNPPIPPVPAAPKQICSVTGGVTTVPGVSDTPTHNEYNFIGTDITCPPDELDPLDPVLNAVLDTNLAGSYDVVANGTTDGPDHLVYFDNAGTPATGDLDSGGSKGPGKNDPDHGEDCAVGWGVNGSISVDNPDAEPVAKHAEGRVHFVRVGGLVTAWGYLVWDDDGDPNTDPKKKDQFLAELLFEPAPAEVPKCVPGAATTGKITTATLQGVAVIFNDPLSDIL